MDIVLTNTYMTHRCALLYAATNLPTVPSQRCLIMDAQQQSRDRLLISPFFSLCFLCFLLLPLGAEPGSEGAAAAFMFGTGS